MLQQLQVAERVYYCAVYALSYHYSRETELFQSFHDVLTQLYLMVAYWYLILSSSC